MKLCFPSSCHVPSIMSKSNTTMWYRLEGSSKLKSLSLNPTWWRTFSAKFLFLSAGVTPSAPWANCSHSVVTSSPVANVQNIPRLLKMEDQYDYNTDTSMITWVYSDRQESTEPGSAFRGGRRAAQWGCWGLRGCCPSWWWTAQEWRSREKRSPWRFDLTRLVLGMFCQNLACDCQDL